MSNSKDLKRFIGGVADSTFIQVPKYLHDSLGMRDYTYFLSILIDKLKLFTKLKKLGEQNEFYWTVEEMEKELYISKKTQLRLINKLESLGLLEVSTKGIPRKRYFFLILRG